MRVEIDTQYARDAEAFMLPRQVLYVSKSSVECSIKFIPAANDASAEERQAGMMKRTLIVSTLYKEGRKNLRSSSMLNFVVRLNSEKIVRRIGSLGNILGMSPR